MPEFSADDIKVLTGLQAVRKRPALYVGPELGAPAMHSMALALIEGATEEAYEKGATHIEVTLGSASFMLEDDGPGISTRQRQADEMAVLEMVVSRLHACWCGCGQLPGHRQGLTMASVGLAPVNALSTRFRVETAFEGELASIEYERGEIFQPFTRHGPTDRKGIRIEMEPDLELLQAEGCTWDAPRLRARCAELEELVEELTITLCDKQ